MNQSLKYLFLMSFVFLALACESPSNEQFDTKLKTSDVRLINIKGRSCKLQIGDPLEADDLTAITAQVGSFRIRWQGKSALNLEYIEFHFSGPNLGEQVVPISGQDLAYLWNGGPVLFPIQPMTTDQSSSAACIFQIGGIKIEDIHKSSYGSGRILIFGTTLEGEELVPVTSEEIFSYRYDGIK